MSELEELEKRLADLKMQREKIMKQEIPVERETTPKKKKKVTFEEMVDIVDRYQEDQGQVVAGVSDGDMQINFFIPKDVFDKIDGKMTIEEATDFFMNIAWGRNWALGMARAVYGPTRWNILSKHEQEDIMRDIIRRKLAPSLLGV